LGETRSVEVRTVLDAPCVAGPKCVSSPAAWLISFGSHFNDTPARWKRCDVTGRCVTLWLD